MLLHAKHITLWLLFALMCTSCTGVHDLREARSTVARADSLRAVHSRTKDHEIKGRSWSNIGTMSHAAGEFALSYDMYEKSAECFLKGKDTIMHYFAKNAMVVELAELSMHDEALVLIDDIIQECSYWPVIAKAYEAQAILYFNIEQYDSVLYSVDRLQAYGNHEPVVEKSQEIQSNIADKLGL